MLTSTHISFIWLLIRIMCTRVKWSKQGDLIYQWHLFTSKANASTFSRWAITCSTYSDQPLIQWCYIYKIYVKSKRHGCHNKRKLVSHIYLQLCWIFTLSIKSYFYCRGHRLFFVSIHKKLLPLPPPLKHILSRSATSN